MTTGVDRLHGRLGLLGDLVELGQDRMDEELLQAARTLRGRARTRLRLSGEHTVVALAGATGSGKSSLFNAIAGLDLSSVSVRRPTTDAIHACVWGLEGARPLLDWLAVEKRHRYARASALDGDTGWSLQGLVLLDLPDHDSVQVDHRLEVDRLVEVADLVIWVVDPQKYADRAIHDRYLRTLGFHRVVTALVLNHSDRLTDAACHQCLTDLRRLLESDGLPGVRVLATSATAGTGIAELRSLLVDTAAERRAAGQRLAADIDRLLERVGAQAEQEAPTGIDQARRSRLVEALAEAAGVRAAGASLEGAIGQRGRLYVGWLFAVLARAVRADPLRRVGLRQEDGEVIAEAGDQFAAAQRSMADDAVTRAAEGVAGMLPASWGGAVRSACHSRATAIPDSLGEITAFARRASRQTPVWWQVARGVQAVLATAAVVGLAWAGCLTAFALLQAAPAPWWILRPRFLPYAAALMVAGAVLGALAGWLGTRLARSDARRRRGRAEAQMLLDIEGLAHSVVFLPVGAELERYARFREKLAEARSPSPTSPASSPAEASDSPGGVADGPSVLR